MELATKTILISGGSAGIGFEIARQLVNQGNHVIITGRNKKRLKQAKKKLKTVSVISCDVTDKKDINGLITKIKHKFPTLSILINCAGYGTPYSITSQFKAWKIASKEIDTNYLSLIRLTEKLLPTLQQQPDAAIVNVTSVAALSPNIKIPTYSASKAAVHSYTEGLRLALRDTAVKIFELMPPLVNTEFSAGIGGKENGISPVEVATALLDGMKTDIYEIHVGKTALIFDLVRTSPAVALNAMNGLEN